MFLRRNSPRKLASFGGQAVKQCFLIDSIVSVIQHHSPFTNLKIGKILTFEILISNEKVSLEFAANNIKTVTFKNLALLYKNGLQL